MPLSTIFQLYRGGQFYRPSGIQTHNVSPSGDRY
jgi:hypothetical protein